MQSSVTKSGNYNYHVDLVYQGYLPYQNTVISINAYTDSTKQTPIQISVYWQKVLNNQQINISEINSNSYHVQATDIGHVLQASVNSLEPTYKGICKLVFGEIVIEPQLKTNLFQCLNGNYMKFDIKLQDNVGKLSLNQEYLTVLDFKNKRQIRLKYYYNWPKVEIQYQSPKILKLVFDQSEIYKNSMRTNDLQEMQKFLENYQNMQHLELEMVNKQNKDLFVLGLKSFIYKNQLLNQYITNNSHQSFDIRSSLNQININKSINSDEQQPSNSLFRSIRNLFFDEQEQKKEDMNETKMEYYYNELNNLGKINKQLMKENNDLKTEKDQMCSQLGMRASQSNIQVEYQYKLKYQELLQQNQQLKQNIQQYINNNQTNFLPNNNQQTINNFSQILGQVDRMDTSQQNNTVNQYKNQFEAQKQQILMKEQEKKIASLNQQLQSQTDQLEMYKKSVEILKSQQQQQGASQVQQSSLRVQQLESDNRRLQAQVTQLQQQNGQLQQQGGQQKSFFVQKQQGVQQKQFDEQHYQMRIDRLTQEKELLQREKDKLAQLIQTYMQNDHSSSELHYTKYMDFSRLR